MTMLKLAPVIPLVQASDPAIAVRTAKALKAGGLTTLEAVSYTHLTLPTTPYV